MRDGSWCKQIQSLTLDPNILIQNTWLLKHLAAKVTVNYCSPSWRPQESMPDPDMLRSSSCMQGFPPMTSDLLVTSGRLCWMSHILVIIHTHAHTNTCDACIMKKKNRWHSTHTLGLHASPVGCPSDPQCIAFTVCLWSTLVQFFHCLKQFTDCLFFIIQMGIYRAPKGTSK